MPFSQTLFAFTGSLLLVACAMPHAVTNPAPGNDEYVILLHGLARTPRSMGKLQKSLIDAGYGTCNVGYPSRSHGVEELVDRFVFPKIEESLPDSVGRVHFVTHSLGGIVLRQLLKEHPMEKLGHVVMLSPPNQGSEVVDELGSWKLFEFVNGPAGNQLGTSPSHLPSRLGPANWSLGIITGDRTINPILSSFIPGPDDGKVSVERAQLEGMADFRVISTSHPFIMRNDEVIGQVLFFLKNGAFRSAETPPE